MSFEELGLSGHLNKHIVKKLFDKDMKPKLDIIGPCINLDAFYNGQYWIIPHPCAHNIIESAHYHYANKDNYISNHKIVPILKILIDNIKIWDYNH